MKSQLKDPDLARLFENTFPNTLGMALDKFLLLVANSETDTTVKYYNQVGRSIDY
jgi:hypothetical protein